MAIVNLWRLLMLTRLRAKQKPQCSNITLAVIYFNFDWFWGYDKLRLSSFNIQLLLPRVPFQYYFENFSYLPLQRLFIIATAFSYWSNFTIYAFWNLQY